MNEQMRGMPRSGQTVHAIHSLNNLRILELIGPFTHSAIHAFFPGR